ncbi:TetR/AcrR family transcriptional regulator [Marinobacterium litorale]|uniref:TetR/AcrR family transcriptional regulator n=1 Tax=Marinobacterium litorale TaxID=404770 RepID=UPI00042644BE|nr:TetR/AcrR family transcriptional regulator [Marinobacterium litorale]
MKDAVKESNTATRIIGAAEALFAEQGFAETTMRQITARAEVNLAAVNYHYGSKSGLIEAVARRFMDPLCQRLESMLAERAMGEGESQAALDELIEMLMRALLLVEDENPHALALFMRLLDLAYTPDQGELRQFLIDGYGQRVAPYIELLQADSAPMSKDEFFWRLHFLLGALIFTLSNQSTLSSLRDGDAGAPDIERILHRMIPVLVAGFQARGEVSWFSRV